MSDDVSTRPHEAERQPSVCIVIPTRPPAPHLARVIHRLIAQRYEGTIEILVVIDNGGEINGLRSPPSLSGTVRRAVRTISNTQEPGLDGARRTGRAAAHGEVVVFCGDEEEWPPDRLRTIVLRRFVARGSSEAPHSAHR
jgi:glycosyltransferase involved in cell wall biosynthesis